MSQPSRSATIAERSVPAQCEPPNLQVSVPEPIEPLGGPANDPTADEAARRVDRERASRR